jgi:putative transposase
MNQSPFVRDDLNKLILDTLREEQERQNCTVFTYCLMPDHLHFLVSPRKDGISVLTFTNQYKGKATNRSWTVGWQGKLWQPRYYDHIVRTEESLYAIAEYILNNPIRQALVEHTEDWSWSGHMNPLPITNT